jgi:hypothetical protein
MDLNSKNFFQIEWAGNQYRVSTVHKFTMQYRDTGTRQVHDSKNIQT